RPPTPRVGLAVALGTVSGLAVVLAAWGLFRVDQGAPPAIVAKLARPVHAPPAIQDLRMPPPTDLAKRPEGIGAKQASKPSPAQGSVELEAKLRALGYVGTD